MTLGFDGRNIICLKNEPGEVVEFDHFEIRIMDHRPYTKTFICVPVPHLISDMILLNDF